MNPLLSVVIVNHNCETFLVNCINSVKNYVNCPVEIILVDNASNDNSLELIKEKFTDIITIKSETNLGFAAGNNLGVKHSSGEYLLLLNADAQLTNSPLPAIELLKSNKSVGVVGGLLKYQSGEIQSSFGYFHTPIRIVFSWLSTKNSKLFPNVLKRIETNKSQFNGVKKVDWVSGALLLTKKELWDKINGMNEQYFMYMDDVDYSKRLLNIGYITVFSDRINTIHHERAGRLYLDYSSLIYTVNSYIIYTKNFHHYFGGLFVRIGLSIVFTLRGTAYCLLSILHLLKRNEIKTCKNYLKIAGLLITNNLNNINEKQ